MLTESELRSGVIRLHFVALLLAARRLEVGPDRVHWRTISSSLVEHVREGDDEIIHSVRHGY